MAGPKVEWSLNRDPDLIVEIWSTTALIEAVLAALMADPEQMTKALRVLSTDTKLGRP